MSDVPAAPRPPAPVRVIVIVLWVIAIVTGLGAAAMIWYSGSDNIQEDTDLSQGSLIAVGVFGLLLALFYGTIARGLSRGAPAARTVVLVIVLIHLAAEIGLWLRGLDPAYVIPGIVLKVLIIYLLYGPESSKRHFAPYVPS